MLTSLRSALVAGLLCIAANCATARPAFATVTTTTNTISYTAGGGQSSFAVPFKFTAPADLVVTKNGTGLVIGTNYIVTGQALPAGGVVTLVAPAIAGDAIVITRLMALTQPTSFRNAGVLQPFAIENAVDRLAMEIQQVSGGFSGTATALAPGALSADSPVLGDGTVGNHLRWDFTTANTWTGANTFNGTTQIGGNFRIAVGSAQPFNLAAGSGIFSTTTGENDFNGSPNYVLHAMTFQGGALASGSSAFDLSGSSGTFKAPTGAATFGGPSNTFANGWLSNGNNTISLVSSFAGLTLTNTGGGSGLLISTAGGMGPAIYATGNAFQGPLQLTSSVAPSAPGIGMFYFDNSALLPEYYDGTAFRPIPGTNRANVWSAQQVFDAGVSVKGNASIDGGVYVTNGPGVVSVSGAASPGGTFTGGIGPGGGSGPGDGVDGTGGAAASGWPGGSGAVFFGGADDGLDGAGIGVIGTGGTSTHAIGGAPGGYFTGTDSATGLVGLGGPKTGAGGQFTGGQSGSGVVGTGGADGGSGAFFTGGSDGGVGVVGQGGTSTLVGAGGSGGKFTGGPTGAGVLGTGGATSGNGGLFAGGPSSAGVVSTGGSGMPGIQANGFGNGNSCTGAVGACLFGGTSGDNYGVFAQGTNNGAGGSFVGGGVTASLGVNAQGAGSGSGLAAFGGSTGDGVHGTGGNTSNTGNGVVGTAGAVSGDGVDGNAANGVGVRGTSTGASAGVAGINSAGTGPGLLGTGNATGTALFLTPQAPPSSAAVGTVYLDSVRKKIGYGTGSLFSLVPRCQQALVSASTTTTFVAETGSLGCTGTAASGTVLVQNCSISGTTGTITMAGSTTVTVNYCYW
jgi:hypothetical protein